jgi:hypothetical protein
MEANACSSTISQRNGRQNDLREGDIQNDLPSTISNIEFQAFCLDTEKLLRMEDMWQNRQRPVPLNFDAVSAGMFVLRGEKQTRHVTKTNGSSSNEYAGGLRDQRSLTLPESLELFVSRLASSHSDFPSVADLSQCRSAFNPPAKRRGHHHF